MNNFHTIYLLFIQLKCLAFSLLLTPRMHLLVDCVHGDPREYHKNQLEMPRRIIHLVLSVLSFQNGLFQKKDYFREKQIIYGPLDSLINVEVTKALVNEWFDLEDQ